MLAFLIDGYVYVRRICEDFTVSEESGFCMVPYPKIQVETVVIPEWGHKRIHRIVSNISCAAYDCGFWYCVGPFNLPAEQKRGQLWLNRYAFCRMTGKYTEVAGERVPEAGVIMMRIQYQPSS